jgi:hypothetical protein
VDAVVPALCPEHAAPSNTIATHTARRLAATHPVSRDTAVNLSTGAVP